MLVETESVRIREIVNCDRLARWYFWLERLSMGAELERRRFQFLPLLAEAKRVLILGEGDGRFLQRFLACNPTATVDCVDSSGEMLKQAQRRARPAAEDGAVGGPRVFYHHADARHWHPADDQQYDTVITHFFLDCLKNDEAATLILRIGVNVQPGGSWIVSDFQLPKRGIAAWRARFWVSALYLVFGWTTGLEVRRLPEYHAPLRVAGFERIHSVSASAGMLVSEWWTKSPRNTLNASQASGIPTPPVA